MDVVHRFSLGGLNDDDAGSMINVSKLMEIATYHWIFLENRIVVDRVDAIKTTFISEMRQRYVACKYIICVYRRVCIRC